MKMLVKRKLNIDISTTIIYRYYKRRNLIRKPHHFIPKRSPYWNAQVERAHKTIDNEFYLNPFRIWNTPYEWLHYYNFERIHLSLNGLTIQEKLENVAFDC